MSVGKFQVRWGRGRVDLSQNVGRIERKSPAGSAHGTTIRHHPPPRVRTGARVYSASREGATIARQLLSTHSVHISCFAEAAKM